MVEKLYATMAPPQSMMDRSFSTNHSPPQEPEPRVVLFPLIGGNIEILRAPYTSMSNLQAQQLRSIVTPEAVRTLPPSTLVTPEHEPIQTTFPITISPCSSKEIEELKRRLEVIKQRRAQLRNQHLQDNRTLIVRASDSSQPAEDAITVVTNNASFDIQSSWDPKGLMSSTSMTHKHKSAVRSRVSSKPPRTTPHESVVSTDSRDVLDKIVCAQFGRTSSREHERYSSMLVDEGSAWDPYDSPDPESIRVDPEPIRRPQQEKPSCWASPLQPQERVRSLEDAVPRGKAYSVMDGSEDSESGIAPYRSCIPRRQMAWYVRPNASNVIPDASAQIMQVVYFTKE
jgi:hypothetical protein